MGESGGKWGKSMGEPTIRTEQSDSFQTFKTLKRAHKCEACNCKLCKIFYANLGFFIVKIISHLNYIFLTVTVFMYIFLAFVNTWR